MGPVDCEPAQKGSHDAKEELLRNQKMRSYRPHTDSETKTVTNEPGCRDTMVMHMGSGAAALQGLGDTLWGFTAHGGRKSPGKKTVTLRTQIG